MIEKEAVDSVVSHLPEKEAPILLTSTKDIKTGVIIGRGTERQGLYYVDEVTQQDTVMLAHGTTNREAWLWHRRLGHPSIGKTTFVRTFEKRI
ncbi:hypothetical protein L1987_80142 [Smallanthus sonchifolius]|uniref:Uncharacterized protein n=1 Tax=Smallanthus sonchifolius TaxID=185202 RepID=A0ACB8YMA2_9ASTR|nr:hypothetical protein L1987_80142 [Smallanthus sonchifolius]